MDGETTAVPASGDAVTPEWLSFALKGPGSADSFQSVHTERIGEEYGLASEILRCSFQGACAPQSVVVKLWGIDGAAATREVLFFRTFAARTGIRIPSCYYAAIDENRRRAVLILEDLDNVVQGDCLEELALTDATALAGELSKLHRVWWQHPELDEADWLPSISTLRMEKDWYASRRDLFLRRFEDRIDALTRELVENIELVADEANDRLEHGPLTLLHGDLHLDNIVFDGRTGQPVLLDWARIAKGPAVLDLAELLFEIGSPRDRDRILAVYLSGLRHPNLDEIDEKDLYRKLGGALLRKFISATCGVARWFPASDREVAMINLKLNRTLRSMTDWLDKDEDLLPRGVG